ncbi:MAG TPA: tetratricopeptide repeat protein [Thermoanaerobaculia bacterium]|nr:tetratricopeptide repeat protein [Thermoanaerobaculia bacterium]
MAPAATNLKIEDLRARLKTDPKSRLFFPLAEELRKISQLAEAEQVLRTGLAHHPTYLSAWVSLGRVLHEEEKNREAVEALTRALQLDPGNVVAARLLGDAYLALGDKVEAIKKYKLVRALLPADEDLDATIEALDRELNPPASAAEAFTPPPPVSVPAAAGEEAEVLPFAPPSTPAVAEASPFAPEPEPPPTPPLEPLSETSPFGRPPAFETSAEPWADEGVFGGGQEAEAEQRRDEATGDAGPMPAVPAESPFEEPAPDAGHGAGGFPLEEPQGMHEARPPFADEPPVPPGEPLPPLEAVPPVESLPLPESIPPLQDSAPVPQEQQAAADDVAETLTMADLYVRQGLIGDARQIYERILQRDPMNDEVRTKLAAIAGQAPPGEEAAKRRKVERLEQWLARVGRRESDRV